MNIRTIILAVLLLSTLSLLTLIGKETQVKLTENSIKEAIEAKDTPKLIKALITHMHEELEIDNDRFPELIKEVESYSASVNEPVATALLHSMAAEMYHEYYNQNQWKINQRTQLSDYTPEDIREWTTNLFNKKIQDELALSLKPATALQQSPVSLFADIMLKEKDSETLRPTMYDFLVWRAIDIAPSDQLYTDIISFRRTQPERQALMLAELNYLDHHFKNRHIDKVNAEYIATLDSLMNVYGNDSFSIDIIVKKGEAMSMNIYKSNNQDSVRALVYNFYQEGIKRFPNAKQTTLLKNKIGEMERSELNSEVKNTVYTGTPLDIKVNYKNIKRVNVKVYAIKYSLAEQAAYSRPSKDKRTLVKEQTFSLDLPTSYNTYDTVLHIAGLKPGRYECETTVPGEKMENRLWFSVSKLAAVFRATPDKKTEILVTDYRSGKPIQGATVSYYNENRRNLKKAGEIITDKNGIAVLPANSKASAMQASLPGDTAMQVAMMFVADISESGTINRPNVSLFTDRGLYRPGQNVFFKGIVYHNNKDQQKTVANFSIKAILRDNNYKEVATKTFNTNEFGSFNGEFTLPKSTSSGNFIIEVENYNSTSIRVEEYKRPTFKAEILPIKGEVAFGDNVSIQGEAKTFSGALLNSGNVSWRVTRRPMWPGLYRRGHSASQIASGETKVTKEGVFSFSFIPEKEEGVSLYRSYFSYEVSAIVTDSKGESQECTFALNVGDTNFILLTELAEKVEKEKVSLNITANALNGEKVEATGTYKIYALENGKEYNSSPDKQNKSKEVKRGSFRTDAPINSEVFGSLESGRYLIALESADSKNRKVSHEQTVILYSKKDKRPPVHSSFWLIKEQTTCLPGENASFQIGSSEQDAYVLYDIYSSGKRISRERFTLNNEIKTFTLPFREDWGDGAVAVFTFIKEGTLNESNVVITRKLPNKQLTVKPITFRDKLIPGSKESWSFNILNADSNKVNAEVLAGMYDASLDNILPFNWKFEPTRSIYIPVPLFSGGAALHSSNDYASKGFSYARYEGYAYNTLDWQGVLQIKNEMLFSSRSSNAMGGVMMKSAPMTEAAIVENAEDVLVQDAEISSSVAQEEQMDGVASETQSANIQIRQNFNETAFFYPNLRTNEKGETIISFTLPESNTTWKLQAIAHTPDLMYGKLTKEVIASKPLMVVPNLPRFIRQGDLVSIASQVFNRSEEAISGTVRLELFDPRTERIIQTLQQPTVSFNLESGASTSASWSVSVPEGIDLIACRIIADSETGSDGEQHLLPVLSDKILVTESIPFYFYKAGEKNIKTDITKDGRKPFRLTLEISGNPVWYAVQALPTITTPDNHNIISWFASYYSNTLATSIANAHPKIQQIIRQWSAQGGDAGTLLSNLERNEELKNILLEETPWVLDAQNESEQKARLSLLFDMNRAESQREIAIRRILEEQNPDGGWGWFKGYHSDRTMTLSILKGMKQLVELGAVQYDEAEKRMQMDALRFLDESIQKDYEQLKKHNMQWQNALPNTHQLTYLYVRSGYRDIPELGSAREAIRFYTAQAEKEWKKFSMQGKAETAILMHRNGKKDIAVEILTSLSKTATVSDEMGMYWANNRRGTNFYTSPIDVHTLIMAAFHETGMEQIDDVNKMKQWLLNQKRTQNWETVPSTLNAIHAILLTGSDWLTEQNEVIAKWGNNSISTTSGEEATGYIKETFSANEITADMNSIAISKNGNAPAWGAVYNQYFESLDKVTAAKGSLQVEKKLFIEFNDGKEKQMRLLAPGQSLKTGDKVVVRLTIRTDREMDYVVLKDLRAGCFEPANQLSGYMYRDGLGYYQSPKDVSEQFFFRTLPKGTFVIEYPVYVSRTGEYTTGISSIQCLYTPEFVSHTGGEKIIVE